jgi:hypothetical protein
LVRIGADFCASWADLCAPVRTGELYNRSMPTELPSNPDLSSEVDDLKRQVARLLRLPGQPQLA